MYDSLAVSTDYWRHFIPFAPDITVDVILGKDVLIDLRPYLIQGSRDFTDHFSPDPLVIPDRVPVQRGWRLTFMVSVPPTKGTVRPEPFQQGFLYTPYNSSGNTIDCFNYQLSNGSQLSNYGRININVIQPFSVDWEIRSNDPDATTGKSPVNFSMKMAIAVTHPSFVLGYAGIWGYNWYVEEIFTEPASGRVITQLTKVHGMRTFTDPSQRTSMLDRGNVLASRAFKNDRDVVGIDPITNSRYRPNRYFNRVYCDLVIYPYRRFVFDGGMNSAGQATGYWVTDMGRKDVYRLNIKDFHGMDWNTSGKIILPA